MDISPINSVGASTIANTAATAAANEVPVRQMVTAIHQVNKAELLGQGRQLTFTRDPQTRQTVIQIVDQDSGEVVDSIPPETVLQMAEQLK
jgi:uncharacterized FlaG/YvyC family protein